LASARERRLRLGCDRMESEATRLYNCSKVCIGNDSLPKATIYYLITAPRDPLTDSMFNDQGVQNILNFKHLLEDTKVKRSQRSLTSADLIGTIITIRKTTME
jgi:hypothetical protein